MKLTERGCESTHSDCRFCVKTKVANMTSRCVHKNVCTESSLGTQRSDHSWGAVMSPVYPTFGKPSAANHNTFRMNGQNDERIQSPVMWGKMESMGGFFLEKGLRKQERIPHTRKEEGLECPGIPRWGRWAGWSLWSRAFQGSAPQGGHDRSLALASWDGGMWTNVRDPQGTHSLSDAGQWVLATGQEARPALGKAQSCLLSSMGQGGRWFWLHCGLPASVIMGTRASLVVACKLSGVSRGWWWMLLRTWLLWGTGHICQPLRGWAL